MTAREALPAATNVGRDERFRRHEAICWPLRCCEREPLANDAGRWTWCPDCLTVYDDYGKPVNGIQNVTHSYPGQVH
jgi:hypothetical protein